MGINGFIGKHISAYLKNNLSCNIIGIGRGSKFLGIEEIKYIQADICDSLFAKYISDIISNIDIIIHLAANISFGNEEDLIKVNSLGTLHVCELANIKNVKQIIYMSSIPVIGEPEIYPVTEEHPTKPITLYHTTKLTGEHIILNCSSKNIIRTIMRISSPIGVGMRKNTILSTFLERCRYNENLILYGKGLRMQNYVDVRDISKGIIQIIKTSSTGIYNIANNYSISNIDLAKLCIQESGATSQIKFIGDDKEEGLKWDISIEKAKNVFMYSPQFSVKDTIKWMLKNRRWGNEKDNYNRE